MELSPQGLNITGKLGNWEPANQLLYFMIQKDNNNIVILETNPTRRDYLRSIISQFGYTPISFDRETICLDNLHLLNPCLVISGSLSLERIFRFINAIKMRNNGLRMLIIHDDHEIKQFININGFDDIVLMKPSIEPNDIKNAICRIQDNLLENETFPEYPLIIGNSPEMVKIKKIISELGDSKDTVLIQGGPGTGKELVARSIHYRSIRNNSPFVKINVTDLSSEWLRNAKDAYLGNPGNKKGMFEIADKGTLYLDRIDRAPVIFQAKMLHVLDGKCKSEIDSKGANKADVRVVAATRDDLKLLVKNTDFRKDLFYRLNVINIKIPPLKNRTEDIPLLADFFNDRFCSEIGRCYGDISQKTKDLLLRYHWPGNVREFKNVIKKIVLSADKNNIPIEFIEKNQQHESVKSIDYKQDILNISDTYNIKKYLKDLKKISLKEIQREFITRIEKKLVKEVLVKTNWNRKKASMLLDISYKSLLNKIKAYNLT